MEKLWKSDAGATWRTALEKYDTVIKGQGVERLPDLDRWYREEYAETVLSRDPPELTLEEISRVTEWKMARGVWRHRNLLLVRDNSAADVREASRNAIRQSADPAAPIRELSTLGGVGPATASAMIAPLAPETHPFLDDIVAEQVDGLGAVKYTLGYYRRYATALRRKAEALGDGWNAVLVERALYANAGGKAGVGA